MSIDWYDRCQAAEAELFLLRAEIERLRAALDAIRYDCAGIPCDGCKNAIQLVRRALAGEEKAG